MAKLLAKSASRFHGQFAGVAEAWLESVRRAPDSGSPDEALRRLVLPWETAPPTLLEPRAVIAETAQRLMLSPEKDMRRAVEQRLMRIATDLICVSDRTLELLTDIVWETASRRALILPHETLDVSPVGVMASISLANLSFVYQRLRREPKWQPTPQVRQAIEVPLKLAVEHSLTLRPGDLWLLDLIARTVRFAPSLELRRGASKHGGKTSAWKGLLDRVVPQYVSISLVHKLVEADQFTPQLAKASQFRLWPGVELVVGGEDATVLRALIIGELARRVVPDKAGLARGAMLRFLQAIMALDEPSMRVKARLFVAQVFWEMLEQDEGALTPFFSDQRYADVFRQAMYAVEEHPPDRSPELARDLDRLDELRYCLRTYESYDTLARVLQPPVALTGGSPPEEETTNE